MKENHLKKIKRKRRDLMYTVANQRIVKIHREKAERNFLGINNETWKAASRDLGAHAFLLYIYFASNANNFDLALSPAAIQKEIGMPTSTYRDQFKKLMYKGYIVEKQGNIYDFYERPQPRNVIDNSTTETLDTIDERKPTLNTDDVQPNPCDDREINNINIINKDNINIDNSLLTPKVKTVTIKQPQRQGKQDIKFNPKPKNTFVF